MSRILAWTDEAWQGYLYWQSQDRKTLKRINKLIEDTKREPFVGIGKPEPLRENLSGFWSRRIDDTNRLVYAVNDNFIAIISCRYHY
ncbi:toxin YoeB [Desulfosarcina sp. BuS5]|uniref:Txe/YoeB family addiction module toxin n=1 Tax=Desulfosarcina sp. BuS5 TaxID=933262 RepID=UPI0004827023|nr:Txe/YoeB family addiction module toxin [Desulfosarcina sp. BuS5]WDN88481.1 toxin YoeB [Desulfosarcina sp. BuS5]